MHVRRQALSSNNFAAQRSERVALSNCHSISASATAAPFSLFSLLSLSEKGAKIDANHVRNGRKSLATVIGSNGSSEITACDMFMFTIRRSDFSDG